MGIRKAGDRLDLLERIKALQEDCDEDRCFVYSWNKDQVKAWLLGAGLDTNLANNVYDQNLKGRDLFQLDKPEVRNSLKIGVGHQAKLLKAISHLHLLCKARDVLSWDITQLTEWLKSMKLDDHAESFKSNHMNGRLLLRLDDAKLTALGVKSAQRLKMLCRS